MNGKLVLILLILMCFSEINGFYKQKLNICINNVVKRFYTDREIILTNPDKGLLASLNTSNYIFDLENLLFDDIPSDITTNYLIFTNDNNNVIGNIEMAQNLKSPLTRIIFVSETEELITEIFEILWEKNIYKVVGIDKYDNTIYTLDFDKFSCKRPVALKKLSCDENLGLEKFKLQNCELKVSLPEYEAIIIDKNVTKSGIFMQLLELIVEKEKFKPIFNEPSNVYPEEIAKSHSYTTVMEEFESNFSDIYIGLASMTYEENFLFYCTHPLYEETTYFIVPKPRLLPIGTVISNLFRGKLGTFFHLTFIIGVILLRIFSFFAEENYFKSLSHCTAYLFTLQIGYSVPKIKVFRISVRMFLFCFFVHSIIYNNYWQGQLYSISVKPFYEKPIKTLRDVLNSNLTMRFQTSAALTFLLLDDDHQKVFDTFQPSEQTDVHYDFDEFVIKRDFVTFSNDLTLRTRPQHKNLYDKIPTFKFYVIHVMKKYHPLFEQYNSRILAIRESGIIMKWLNDAEWTYLLVKNSEDIKDEGNFSVKINPILFMYGFGIAISSIVFVFEIIFWVCSKYICKNYSA